MIPFPFEITGMAGRAEGRVLRRGPGNVAADGIAVATVTTWVSAVITRVVSVGIMTENGRRPAIRRVAYIALLGS